MAFNSFISNMPLYSKKNRQRDAGERMARKIYKFKEKHEVRVETKENESWFVANDICDILGYKTQQMPSKNTASI